MLMVNENYPAMRKVIINAGLNAWCAIGSKQFHRLQVAGNQADVDALMRLENATEAEHALASATAFGLTSAMDDLSKVFEDFRDRIKRFKIPVTIIHGSEDPVFPVASMRDFAREFPNQVELIEFKNAGFTALLTHTGQVIERLLDIATQKPKQQNKTKLTIAG